jgi:subtilisin family serine protease
MHTRRRYFGDIELIGSSVGRFHMFKGHRHFTILLPILAAAIALPTQAVSAETKVGVASRVNNQVTGVVHGALLPLADGSEVFGDQTVRTGEASAAHLIFLDQTNFQLGPNSEVVLDKFVYDRDKATGEVVIKVSKGIFRFVTGSLTPSSYQIKTPVATLGVRGTILDLLLENNSMTLLLVKGASDITMPNGDVVSLTEPGTALVVYPGGRSDPPKPFNGRLADSSGFSFPPAGSLADVAGALNFGATVGGESVTRRSGITNNSRGSATPNRPPVILTLTLPFAGDPPNRANRSVSP